MEYRPESFYTGLESWWRDPYLFAFFLILLVDQALLYIAPVKGIAVIETLLQGITETSTETSTRVPRGADVFRLFKSVRRRFTLLSQWDVAKIYWGVCVGWDTGISKP